MSMLERELVERIAELAEASPEEVTRDALLADIGVDSLMALDLVAFVEKRLGIEIPEKDIRTVYTLDDILRLIDGYSR